MSYYRFFDELIKPNYTPPAIVFRVVWPILYLLMFVSLYIFLKAPENSLKAQGLWLFLFQLAFNFMWSPIFFYYKKLHLAFVIALILTTLAAAMIVVFTKVSVVAGILNIPYLLWLIFANVLNYKIWILNKYKIG